MAMLLGSIAMLYIKHTIFAAGSLIMNILEEDEELLTTQRLEKP